MKIAFVVNELKTEKPNYSTTLLTAECAARGHETYIIGVADFAIAPDDSLRAAAVRAGTERHPSPHAYLADLQSRNTEDLSVDDLDILMLRNDPGDDPHRPWARYAGVTYGLLAMRRGVTVLNDPHGLATARDKQYLQYFPPSVRPKALTTRDVDRIEAFVAAQNGPVVLKPTAGSGGRNVFLASGHDGANLRQMIDAVERDGYVVVQEYIPAIEEGDVRILLVNGRLLECDGIPAAFRRRRRGVDLRCNISAGGVAEAIELAMQRAHAIIEIVRPRLVRDGMFLVGLDIAGDKVIEINVYSSGGLGPATELYGVDFVGSVVDILERKAEYMHHYQRQLDNVGMATL